MSNNSIKNNDGDETSSAVVFGIVILCISVISFIFGLVELKKNGIIAGCLIFIIGAILTIVGYIRDKIKHK